MSDPSVVPGLEPPDRVVAVPVRRRPRWVVISWIVAAFVVAVFLIMHLSTGGLVGH